MDLGSKLTILTVTHYSPLETYGELAPPTTGIVAKTVESVRENLRGAESCRHLLFYNYPVRNERADAKTYEENLAEFARQEGLVMYRTPNDSLRNTLAEAVERIETPYVLFVEHDWEFLAEIDLREVIATFEANEAVNHVRFNKYENAPAGWDSVVVEDRSKRIPLCKVDTYSNNPHVVRRAELETWLERADPDLSFWIDLYRSDAWPNTVRSLLSLVLRSYARKYVLRKGHTQYLDDVEVVLDKRYKAMVRQVGFPAAHAKMGTYLYGPKNAGPYVRHLGRDV